MYCLFCGSLCGYTFCSDMCEDYTLYHSNLLPQVLELIRLEEEGGYFFFSLLGPRQAPKT